MPLASICSTTSSKPNGWECFGTLCRVRQRSECCSIRKLCTLMLNQKMFARRLASAGLRSFVLATASAKEIDEAFTTFAQAHPAALLMGSDPYLLSARKQLIALAAHQSIPAMFSGRAAAADGGLMSYGISFADGYRQAGIYVSRVLKGEKPTDLPVIRTTKFELVINLATAKQLGLAIPSAVLAIADEVIE